MFSRVFGSSRSLSIRNVRNFSTSSFKKSNEVWIVAGARTPIGSFMGSLSSLSATQLGSHAVKEAVVRSGVAFEDVNEVILGNVISSGLGQAPATQAAMRGGIPFTTPVTTINKVCASGMKALMFGAQSILTGQNNVVVAGGFESMSNAPFLLPNARTNGLGLGHASLLDANIKDGLWDAFDNVHMGSCAEVCSSTYNIGRAEQDAFALESFRRAVHAQKNGLFSSEIAPITITDKKGNSLTISSDEGPAKLKADKVPSLKPVFKKDGTVTAANASSLNDGACALVIVSSEWAKKKGITKPLAIIRGFADAQRKPVEFTVAPADAIPKALANARIRQDQVDAFEINEAFAVVGLANQKLLNLDGAKININGGAIALGHPIGCSGARIVLTLANILHQKNLKYGVAAICNGGGGASAIVLEKPS